MPSFNIISTNPKGYYAPDLQMYPEKWWNDPSKPTAPVNLEIADKLLSQVAEDGPNGKKSCFLTCQLNAMIARGGIDPERASEIQSKLVKNANYNGYWLPYGDGNQRGWTPRPHHLAFVLNKDFGIRAGLEVQDSGDLHNSISKSLLAGYAVVLLGKSAVGGHARLAFSPDDAQEKAFVHDPRYPETTGRYDCEQLADFQTEDYVVIY